MRLTLTLAAALELLLSCKSTFASVLLSTPGTMSYILRTHPELLAQILRDDPTLLAVAFALVPHLLSETLEKHPEFFLDVAHRRPILVTKLFAKHPDLLMVRPARLRCRNCHHVKRPRQSKSTTHLLARTCPLGCDRLDRSRLKQTRRCSPTSSSFTATSSPT